MENGRDKLVRERNGRIRPILIFLSVHLHHDIPLGQNPGLSTEFMFFETMLSQTDAARMEVGLKRQKCEEEFIVFQIERDIDS